MITERIVTSECDTVVETISGVIESVTAAAGNRWPVTTRHWSGEKACKP